MGAGMDTHTSASTGLSPTSSKMTTKVVTVIVIDMVMVIVMVLDMGTIVRVIIDPHPPSVTVSSFLATRRMSPMQIACVARR